MLRWLWRLLRERLTGDSRPQPSGVEGRVTMSLLEVPEEGLPLEVIEEWLAQFGWEEQRDEREAKEDEPV